MPAILREIGADMIDVVVIGEGISGIACAWALHAVGLLVRLIDKGCGVGGRMATLRTAVADSTFTCKTKGKVPNVFK